MAVGGMKLGHKVSGSDETGRRARLSEAADTLRYQLKILDAEQCHLAAARLDQVLTTLEADLLIDPPSTAGDPGSR